MVNLGAFRAELERRGFKTSYFDTAGQASDYLDQALDGRTTGLAVPKRSGIWGCMNGLAPAQHLHLALG